MISLNSHRSDEAFLFLNFQKKFFFLVLYLRTVEISVVIYCGQASPHDHAFMTEEFTFWRILKRKILNKKYFFLIQILPVNLPWDVNCWRSRSCQCGWTLPSFAYPPNDCLLFPLWPAQVWWQPKAAIKIMGSPKNPSLDNLLLYQITKQVVDHNLFWSYHRSRFEPFFLLSFCCDWGMHAVLENCIIRLEKMMNFEMDKL